MKRSVEAGSTIAGRVVFERALTEWIAGMVLSEIESFALSHGDLPLD
jgi:hypothetical protein